MKVFDSSIRIIGISSPSGGGKTTITGRVSKLLPGSVAVYFDEYDCDTIHPVSFRQWLKDGADYNDWKTEKLSEDLSRLKAGKRIMSPVDGCWMPCPDQYVIFDTPFGYVHCATGGMIDLSVYIDTPLDVAMARRLIRDFSSGAGFSEDAKASLMGELKAYLEYGRQAYLEMEKQVKPRCDLIVDGCLSSDEISQQIVDHIRPK